MNLEHLVRPRTAATGFVVIGVEPDRAQLVWSSLRRTPTELRVECDERPGRARVVELASPGGEHLAGPGAIELTELTPSTHYTVTVRARAVGNRAVGNRAVDPERMGFRTLDRPDGEELFRFATVSDLHLGRGPRQYRGPLAGTGRAGNSSTATASDSSADPTVACAHAAVAHALEWGAQLMVVKGDVCEETDDHAWGLAADLFGGLPVPVRILPGNHDTGADRRFEPERGAAARGLDLTRGVDHLDVDGLRVVLVDSTRPGHGWGAIARHAEPVADLAADAPAGVFVATHHQAQRISVPLYWPHGIPGPDARSFARTLRRASRSALISSGHTHRCRVRRVAGVTWSEVAATNHYPGMWAGYRVFDGGITQTVRRITDPTAMSWCEHTRDAFGGAWALWSPGALSDRSFALRW